jgi:paraquat-inducible protein B
MSIISVSIDNLERVPPQKATSKVELLWLIPLIAMFVVLTVTAETLAYVNGTSALW